MAKKELMNSAELQISSEELLEYFEREHSLQMRLLQAAGVHPNYQEPFLNPYTREMDDEDFGNVGEHCMRVALAAKKIAERVFKNEPARVKSIVSRALIHDLKKRLEVYIREAEENGTPPIDATYESIIEENLKKARITIDEQILDNLEIAGQETGHENLSLFFTFDKKEGIVFNPNVSLETMIIHLTDCMTFTPIPEPGQPSTTTYLPYKERAEQSDFRQRYPELFEKGISLPDGTTATYYDLQEWIATQICIKLKEKINPTSPTEPNQFIADFLSER